MLKQDQRRAGLLRHQLPPESVATMAQYEAAHDYENPAYLAAVHVTRLAVR